MILNVFHLISGTIFLEVWKRKNAELAYKWDVDGFEDQVSDVTTNEFFGIYLIPLKTIRNCIKIILKGGTLKPNYFKYGNPNKVVQSKIFQPKNKQF